MADRRTHSFVVWIGWLFYVSSCLKKFPVFHESAFYFRIIFVCFDGWATGWMDMVGGLMNGVLMRVVCSPVGLLLYYVCTRDYCLLASLLLLEGFVKGSMKLHFHLYTNSWIISTLILGVCSSLQQ